MLDAGTAAWLLMVDNFFAAHHNGAFHQTAVLLKFIFTLYVTHKVSRCCHKVVLKLKNFFLIWLIFSPEYTCKQVKVTNKNQNI